MLVAAADLFLSSAFSSPKGLNSSVTRERDYWVLRGSQLLHTPDAGPAVSYPGDGTELDWEYDEERSRYYVRYPDDQ